MPMFKQVDHQVKVRYFNDVTLSETSEIYIEETTEVGLATLREQTKLNQTCFDGFELAGFDLFINHETGTLKLVAYYMPKCSDF